MFVFALQICTFMIDHPDFEVTITILSTFHFISRYIHTFIQTSFHSFMDTFIQALIHKSTNTYLDTCFTYKMVYNSSIVPIYYYCLEFFSLRGPKKEIPLYFWVGVFVLINLPTNKPMFDWKTAEKKQKTSAKGT